jgi:hypothetical protein
MGSLQRVEPDPGEPRGRWLDSWAPSFSRPARASKHPPHRPWGYLRIERFHGSSLWGAQREASPARLGKEREMPHCFVARAITSPHRPTSPISLSSHSPLPNRRTISLPPPMLVSTLNPHLVHSVSLHDVRRHALDDMHSRSARFRVEGQYCSARFFFPFVTMMMCAAARIRVRSVRCRWWTPFVRSVSIAYHAYDEHHLCADHSEVASI